MQLAEIRYLQPLEESRSLQANSSWGKDQIHQTLRLQLWLLPQETLSLQVYFTMNCTFTLLDTLCGLIDNIYPSEAALYPLISTPVNGIAEEGVILEASVKPEFLN